jgi:hypothetical protein
LPCALHPGTPDAATPGGNANVWRVGVVPLAMTSTVAPCNCGSPTTLFGDSGSFP